MLVKLKHILSTYADSELEEMDFWVNSSDNISAIIIDDGSIDLITDGVEIKIDGLITKERKEG